MWGTTIDVEQKGHSNELTHNTIPKWHIDAKQKKISKYKLFFNFTFFTFKCQNLRILSVVANRFKTRIAFVTHFTSRPGTKIV